MIETAKPCGQPCSMILNPFNRAKASYSENEISAPVPGASPLKNPKLASSASLDRSLRPMERSSSSSRLMRVRNSERRLLAIWKRYAGNRLFDLIALV